jgi:hypothetical protein
MKTIFSKEGHGDDQQSLYQFEQENKIVEDSCHPKLRIDKDDWTSIFFKATNGKFYLEKNSCGYKVSLQEFKSEKEYQLLARIYLLDHCQMQFLKISKQKFLESLSDESKQQSGLMQKEMPPDLDLFPELYRQFNIFSNLWLPGQSHRCSLNLYSNAGIEKESVGLFIGEENWHFDSITECLEYINERIEWALKSQPRISST